MTKPATTADDRRTVGALLARCSSNALVMNQMRVLMGKYGVEVTTFFKNGTNYRLRMLGRTATSTGTETTAIMNWAQATIREAGFASEGAAILRKRDSAS